MAAILNSNMGPPDVNSDIANMFVDIDNIILCIGTCMFVLNTRVPVKENFETIGIRQSGNDWAKQDMERQRYNNYNKMQNSKCISFPRSTVWL